MNKIKKITFITVGRSDYLRQLPIIDFLKKKQNINLRVLITGSHSSKLYGETVKYIKKSGVNFENCCPKKYFISSDGISKNLYNCISKINFSLKKNLPDILVLFGDRYEVLAGAMAAFGKNIVIVHVHGGSVTQGSFDDQIRHAITKIAHLHLTSIKEYRNRIHQLGEEKWRIKIVGSPGLDYIKDYSKKLRSKEIKNFLKNNERKFVLVCFHPETNNLKDLNFQLKILKKVINKINFKIVITYPNSDPGSKEIIDFFKKITKNNEKKILLIKNADLDYYYLMKNCKFILGNSSSGIVEAASFQKTVINLGLRQSGKLMPKNVLNSKFNKKSIYKTIEKVLKRNNQRSIKNPYGNGRSGKIIGKYLINLKIHQKLFQKKFISK